MSFLPFHLQQRFSKCCPATFGSGAHRSLATSNMGTQRRSLFAPFLFLGIAFLLSWTSTRAQTATSLDINSRESVTQFYRNVFLASNDVPLDWTGNHVSGDAGTMSENFRAAVLLRINAFRALAGVPANVVFTAANNSKAQQAAFMMSANNSLNHFPPASWKFYTAEGANGAGSSNLALGVYGPPAINLYIADPGANNGPVGHRRWILYPQTQQMGTGDVPSAPGFSAANATVAFDSNFGGPRPATRTPYVAWPAAGYMPAPLVFPRWSFSFPNADFSNATVTLTRENTPVAIQLESQVVGFGENTLVWRLASQSAGSGEPLSVATDTRFRVSLRNVKINGVVTPFDYDVVVFNPDDTPAAIAPTIAAQPTSVTVTSGQTVSFTVSANGSGALTYQWSRNNIPIPGATTATFQIAAAASFDAGIYTVTVSNSLGSVTSSAATLVVNEPASQLPRITGHPESQTVTVGSKVTFYVQADSGAPSLSVQWYKNSIAIPGATVGALTFNPVTHGDAGNYSCAVTNVVGTIFTNSATLTVIGNIPNEPPPVITIPPTSQTLVLGGSVTFTATAEGSGPLTFQWYKDGTPLPGATAKTLAIANARQQDAGSYTVRVVGGGGSMLSSNAVLTISDVQVDQSRLINLSVRQQIVAGGRLIAGFTIGGSQSKLVLIRGVGPGLIAFGVAYPLADPRIEVFSGSQKIAENDSWAPSLAQAFAKAGAFGLQSGSKDAAIVLSLNPGGYTVQAQATDSGAGELLFEVYELAP